MDEFWSMSKKSTAEFFFVQEQSKQKLFAYLHYEQMVEDKKLFALAIDWAFLYRHWISEWFWKHASQLLWQKAAAWNHAGVCSHAVWKLHSMHRPVYLRQLLLSPGRIFYRQWSLQDSSLQPKSCQTSWTYPCRAWGRTPKRLTIIAPKVVTDPMPANEWLYRAMIIYLANKMDPEDLNDIMSMRIFKRNPLQLIDFYRGWIYRTQRQHFEKIVAEGARTKIGFLALAKTICATKTFLQASSRAPFWLIVPFFLERKGHSRHPHCMHRRFFCHRQQLRQRKPVSFLCCPHKLRIPRIKEA